MEKILYSKVLSSLLHFTRTMTVCEMILSSIDKMPRQSLTRFTPFISKFNFLSKLFSMRAVLNYSVLWRPSRFCIGYCSAKCKDSLFLQVTATVFQKVSFCTLAKQDNLVVLFLRPSHEIAGNFASFVPTVGRFSGILLKNKTHICTRK